MAKRKRLTAPNPDYLAGQAPLSAPETRPALPPIAQVAGDTAAAAALSELSRTLQEARDQGRLIQALPLDQVDAGHLVRDRLEADAEDLAVLEASLRARGQQTPIEVVDRGPGAQPRYGLISGWRRLAALRRIVADVPGTTALALVRAPRTASEAYVAMVEENEIRVGLSFWERGRIVEQAVAQGVFADRRAALQTLFANVSRAKRSKIGSFAALVAALDGALRFPTAIGERLGLDLARLLAEDPGAAGRLRAALTATPAASAEAELARLADAARPAPAPPPDPVPETDPQPEARPDPQPQGGVPAAPAAVPDGPPPAPDPVPQAGSPIPRVDASFHPSRRTITLSGPGVTPALMAELQDWLARRGAGGG